MAVDEEGAGAFLQSVSVSGDDSTVNMVGGDVVIGDTYIVESGADFFRHEVPAIRMEGAPQAVYAVAPRCRARGC